MKMRQASITASVALAVGWLGCSTKSTSAAKWTADTLRFQVKHDGEAKLGQYLLLEQHIEGQTSVYTRLAVDLPESWRVHDMRLIDHRLKITLEDGRSFLLDPAKLALLQTAILLGGSPKPDKDLDDLWTTHAR